MGLPKAASYGWSGGYAALTCFPDDTTVLTVEYKINFIAPAAGDHLQGEGIVLKWGRTLTVCRLEVHAIQAERQMLVAAGQQTLICLRTRPARLRVKPGAAALTRLCRGATLRA